MNLLPFDIPVNSRQAVLDYAIFFLQWRIAFISLKENAQDVVYWTALML
jgi:hypothetical protein